MSAGGCWRDHEATPRQQRLIFGRARRSGRLAQTDVLIAMLREAHARGQAVRLPEIMAAGIAQHGARFSELRSSGFVIENETEGAPDGRVLSRYYLRFDPEQDGKR